MSWSQNWDCQPGPILLPSIWLLLLKKICPLWYLPFLVFWLLWLFTVFLLLYCTRCSLGCFFIWSSSSSCYIVAFILYLDALSLSTFLVPLPVLWLLMLNILFVQSRYSRLCLPTAGLSCCGMSLKGRGFVILIPIYLQNVLHLYYCVVGATLLTLERVCMILILCSKEVTGTHYSYIGKSFASLNRWVVWFNEYLYTYSILK